MIWTKRIFQAATALILLAMFGPTVAIIIFLALLILDKLETLRRSNHA